LLLPASCKALKYELLCALINLCSRLPESCIAVGVADGDDSADAERFPNLVSNFPDDLELIIYAASFGFAATPEELETGVMDIDKLLRSGGTLLHACQRDYCDWRSERTVLLALNTLEKRLTSGSLSGAVVDDALWKSCDVKGQTVWKLTLEKRCYAVADVLYEQWRGYENVGPLFDTATGAHILCGTDPIVRMISQCFYLVRWPLSCTELHAIRFEPPAAETQEQRTARMHLDAMSARYARISPALTKFLNKRTNKAGNSLLYELVVTPDNVFKERIKVDAPVAVVEQVLKCGADPRFTERRNKEDPIAVAEKNNRGDGVFSALLRKYEVTL
jgi:hypothetical protein